MSVYLDTSVLVAVVLSEPSSPRVRSWWNGVREPLCVSVFVEVEFSAVVSRAVRTGRLSKGEAEKALQAFDLLLESVDVRGLTHPDYTLANLIIRNFATKLAAPDALHLAATMNAKASLATFDLRLIDAATMLGVPRASI